MRFLFSIVLLLVSGFLFSQSFISAGINSQDSVSRIQVLKIFSEIGHPYPAFELKDGNKIINNRSIQGKVILINFWFEDCPPCMAEMEALNELYKQCKGSKDFVLISISRDNKETIKRVRKKYDLGFDIFSANDKECQRLNFESGYPASIILDKTGTIKKVHIGGSNRKEEANRFVMITLLSEIQALL